MGTPARRPFSLLLKPSGADCNLSCRYCFYRPGGRAPTAPSRMDDATLNAVVAQYLALDLPVHAFCWQGGEPTLMGAAFFRRVTALQERHGRPGAIVANSLQTNAVLVDDALAAHLADYRFLVGCSLDGPPALHDLHRRQRSGAGSHADTIRGIAALQRRGVAVNALCVVTRDHLPHARSLLRYFLDLGLPWQQYLPCVERDARGRPRPCAVDGEGWGRFLCELLDAWLEAGPGRVSVRLFDAVLGRAAGGEPWQCHLADDCRQHLVVEHDGSVYPCDFFVAPRWRLGSVHDAGLATLAASPAWAAFGAAKRATDPACADCFCRDLCQGDCPRLRAPDGWPPRGRSALCRGWRLFYAHAARRLGALAADGASSPPSASGAPGPRGGGR